MVTSTGNHGNQYRVTMVTSTGNQYRVTMVSSTGNHGNRKFSEFNFSNYLVRVRGPQFISAALVLKENLKNKSFRKGAEKETINSNL